jgi:hypothetical protein
MKLRSGLFLTLAAGTALLSWPWVSGAQVSKSAAQIDLGLRIDSDDIGGVVRSAKGPEAGVWVIAETKDLPTKFVRIVVTDDQGRYVIPDLPKANYNVFVRGYGLIDSKPVRSDTGKLLNLTAMIAPSPLAAAQYYPADYWYSLIKVPPKSEFPMKNFQTQQEWVTTMKESILLIQIGDKATREIPEKLGKFKSNKEAWEAWSKSQDFPMAQIQRMGPRGIEMYADWTDRIQAGEVPPAPPRPQGAERNLVITEWDWSNDRGFLHDDIATDKTNPRVNANGLIYGLEQYSADVIDFLDPLHHTTGKIHVPVQDPESHPFSAPESYWKVPLEFGDEIVRPGVASLHNPMFDSKGRLWMTAQIRTKDKQPGYCKAGSDNPSAKFFPLNQNLADGAPEGRELEMYDPVTKQFTFVDVCYGTHHLEFANDANRTLWTSGGKDVIGWVNTKKWEETHDIGQSQGWCPYILDTNGNGKPDPGWVEPMAGERRVTAIDGGMGKIDPTRDMRIRGSGYGLTVNSPDGAVWEAIYANPGYILRVSPGANPPYTCVTEIYKPPARSFANSPKGIDVDANTGLVWVAFATSGTFASFDRRKCKVLNGPTATGDHCPEGWQFYPSPGPAFKNVSDPINTDYHYLNWVDQFDTFGLGRNVPFAPGTNSDSMLAFLPNEKKFLQFRIPYPLGFYARGVDGRIDDPDAGWKGKGLWSTYASVSPWHYEGGRGATSKVVNLKLRPDPLAH